MKPLRILLCAVPILAIAQTNPAGPTLLLTVPPSAAPGTTINLTLTTSGFPASSIANFGWTFQLPAGMFLLADSWTASPMMQAAGFAISGGPPYTGCSAVNDTNSCGLNAFVAAGTANGVLTNNPITVDGVIGTFPVAIPITATGVLTFGVVNTSGDDINQNQIPILPGATAQTATVQITPLPPVGACDVNGDGVVNGADVSLVITAELAPSTSCPIAGSAGPCTLTQLSAVIRAALGLGCSLQ